MVMSLSLSNYNYLSEEEKTRLIFDKPRDGRLGWGLRCQEKLELSSSYLNC